MDNHKNRAPWSPSGPQHWLAVAGNFPFECPNWLMTSHFMRAALQPGRIRPSSSLCHESLRVEVRPIPPRPLPPLALLSSCGVLLTQAIAETGFQSCPSILKAPVCLSRQAPACTLPSGALCARFAVLLNVHLSSLDQKSL